MPPYNAPRLPSEIYLEHFTTIGAIKTSQREIDVLACILNGRTAKGTAHFLSISPKTVETHTYNLMKKLECSSRESMISLIENSDKLLILKEYYLCLMVYIAFKKDLKKILESLENDNIECNIISWSDKDAHSLIAQLKDHLKLAGLHVLLEERKTQDSIAHLLQEAHGGSPTLYIVSEEIFHQVESAAVTQWPQNLLFITFETEKTHNACFQIYEPNGEKIDFSIYYSFVFEIIKKIIPSRKIEGLTEIFSNKYESSIFSGGVSLQSSQSNTTLLSNVGELQESQPTKKLEPGSRLIHSKRFIFLGGIGCISGLCALFFFLRGTTTSQILTYNQQIYSQNYVRSDLIIPNESLFLPRPHLLAQIETLLKPSPGIRTVVLIGEGGAGKTTLARQYAKGQPSSLVWEINAETKDSLKKSIEDLAFALAQDEKDKSVWRSLKEIQDAAEREKKVLAFVKKKLKLQDDWLLIFDNINHFNDIKEYIPHDTNIWGSGKIIITTRDSNIKNNTLINSNNIISLRGLNDEEKYALFSSILYSQGSPHLEGSQRAELKRLFLEIPPFPLDIITAAYYIKDTKISFQEYIRRIKELKNDFAKEQENILKEINYYTKTRYSIITLTLDKIIAEDPNFKELLFFISLLDSQNISKELLEAYKQSPVVEKFLRLLRKHSFLTHEAYLDAGKSTLTFSIHRNTQKIMQIYLATLLPSEKIQKLIEAQVKAMETYASMAIKDDNITSQKVSMAQIGAFLQNCNTISHSLKGGLLGQLGYIYLNFGDYKRAERLLNESLNIYKVLDKNYSLQEAWILKNIGILQIAICKFKEAQCSLEKSLALHEKAQSKNDIEKANVLKNLAEAYRSMGNPVLAEKFINQALHIFYQDSKKYSVEIASALTRLGTIHRNKGEFIKAKDYLEKAITIYNNEFGVNHIKTSYVLALLGRNYRNLGYYGKAKEILEKELVNYEAYYGKSHTETAGILMVLGATYLNLGDLKKAKDLCENALNIYKSYYEPEHVMIAEVSGYLGAVYKELGAYEKAKESLQFIYNVYLKHYGAEHIRVSQILCDLAQIYLTENKLDTAEELIQKSYKIYKNNNHSEIYLALEVLAQLYQEKSKQALQKKDNRMAQKFKEQAIAYIKEALGDVKKSFNDDSPLLIRLENEMRKF